MIHIPTEKEQIELCIRLLYLGTLENFKKKWTPENIGHCISEKVFIIAVNQILKEPLSEMELYYFTKNVLNKNKALLIKSIEHEKL